MPTFAPVDEQLTYLKKGAAEIIREADLRAKRLAAGAEILLAQAKIHSGVE